MKKKIFIVLFIFILPFLFVLSRVKLSQPQAFTSNQQEDENKKNNDEYINPTNKTVDGVDYLVSNIPLGKFGGTLVVTTIGEGPKTFNPWESRDATSSQIGELLYDSLVTTNVLNGEVIPKLAYDFKILDGGKTYIFHLRKGLKWTDGEKITADDVVFTFNDIVFKGLGNTSTRDSLYIDGRLPKVAKLDDYTVKFTISKPFAPFLRMISVPIAPKHILKKYTDIGEEAFNLQLSTNSDLNTFITSGAFILEEYIPAQRIVLKRNPNYYVINKDGKKLPYIDKYIFQIVQDQNTELLKFQSKESDVINLNGYYVSKYIDNEANSDYKVYNLGPTSSTLFLCFNLNDRKNEKGKFFVDEKKQKWFNDRNFREAIDYAIDRDAIIFNVSSGVGAPLFTAESLQSIFLNKKIAKGHKVDLKRSLNLLEKSGFYLDKNNILRDKNENVVEFDLLTNAGNLEREIIGVMIKEDLSNLGIKVNFKPIEFNTLVNRITNTLEWDTVVLGLTGSPLEPHGGKNVWYSYGALHMFNKRKSNDNPKDILPFEKELDNIFDKASLEIDFNKRKKLYDKYQEIIYYERPFIYLYSPLNIVAVRNRVKNLYPTSLGGVLHNLDEIYIDNEN